MPTVTVRIPMPLRTFTRGADAVSVEGATIGEVLNGLASAYDGIGSRIFTPQGEMRSFVNVYLADENIQAMQGLSTPVPEGSVIRIIPAVAGGVEPKARDRRLLDLRASIPHVTPREIVALQAKGAVLIDVREKDEIAQGSPTGALRLGRGYLELKIEQVVPDLDGTVALICGSGNRSLFAAEDLMRMGYSDVRSVAGGFNRWKAEGLPMEIPPVLGADALERYSRHLLMPEVGEVGQLKLLSSRVLLVGAGGLGSPAAFYLGAAGVGTLGMVDHDVVDRSNLQRQILHRDDRIGWPKVDSARATLLALNPSIKVEPHAVRLEVGNVEDLLRGYDVVVDGSDNFATRYLVNDACVKLGVANVYGAVFRFEGQVSVFWPRGPRGGPCYRCLYPDPPPAELAPSCAEAGVLGVLPGVIGLLQAVETVKLLLDMGEPLIGRMLFYDALEAQFTELKLRADPTCRYCAAKASFPGYMDYEELCASREL